MYEMSPGKKLKVLVVGSGGREHTLAQACRESPLCREVIAAPGNGGIRQTMPCFPIPADDVPGLVRLAEEEKVDLVVAGPEIPLSLGLADALRARGILVYGPGKAAARLESSKIFTKELLKKYDIPTAAAEAFDSTGDALAYLEKTATFPVVIKADGLAAGKGVSIAGDFDEAAEMVRGLLDRRELGESGASILIEERLEGEEASIHLMVSGRAFVTLPASQDHKRIGENDTGPNTGGMGAYSPTGALDEEMEKLIHERISAPAVEAIAAEGLDFRGTLFIGLMMTPSGPSVLEFNVRFGDPETQVILPRMETDPLLLMLECASGKLETKEVKVRPETALCVVLAAGGYPGAYRRNDPILTPREFPHNAFLFHAGTRLDEEGKLMTDGGRVLGVTVLAEDIARSSRQAYELCETIHFPRMYYRRDIGARELARTDGGRASGA